MASGSEPDKIALSLEVTGLKKYFTHIYSSLQVPRGKPYPDIFLFAARELKFAPEQCIVIEDSTPGVQAALQAGMTVLWYKPIPENEAAIPEKVTAFADMADLPAILSGILKNAHPQ